MGFGVASFALNNKQLAFRELAIAKQLNPLAPQPYLNNARMEFAVGRYMSAILDLEKAFQVGQSYFQKYPQALADAENLHRNSQVQLEAQRRNPPRGHTPYNSPGVGGRILPPPSLPSSPSPTFKPFERGEEYYRSFGLMGED